MSVKILTTGLDVGWPLMKVIITFTFCCNNYGKVSLLLWKNLGNFGNYFSYFVATLSMLCVLFYVSSLTGDRNDIAVTGWYSNGCSHLPNNFGSCQTFPVVYIRAWDVSQNLGMWTLPNTCFLGPFRVHSPARTLISFAILWQTDAHTDLATSIAIGCIMYDDAFSLQ